MIQFRFLTSSEKWQMRRKIYLASKSFVQTANNGRQCCVRLHAAKRLTNEKFGGVFGFWDVFWIWEAFCPYEPP